MELIDTHTHLDHEDFDPDREQIIERAKAAGVTRLITIGSSRGFKSAEAAISLAENHACVWATAGIHPCCASEPEDADRLLQLATHPRVVGIGETGLDFYRDSVPPRENQYWWLETQIAIARQLKKPLSIHSREAGKECLEVLTRLNARDVGGVFHCYAEDVEFEKKLCDINFLVSFPGIVTFKKAFNVHETARAIPLEHILLETDAPYLAPDPFRGKRCETSHMIHTAKKIAELKGISLEKVAAQTTQNALSLFHLEVLPT